MLDLIQWPAMIVTLASAWLVASTQKRRRLVGFGLFLVSNALWVTWGVSDSAWALVTLQACLVMTNVRGIVDNEDDDGANRAG